ARMDLACELVDSNAPEIARLRRNGYAAARNGSPSRGLQNAGIAPARAARLRSQAMTRPNTPLSTAPSGRDAASRKRSHVRRGKRAATRSLRYVQSVARSTE